MPLDLDQEINTNFKKANVLKISNLRIVSEYLHLEQLREEDMPLIKDWRNSQIAVLRQKKPLTDEDQRTYYSSVIIPAQSDPKPTIILYSYIKSDDCIGYGGLTNINWSEKAAEISFLLNPIYKENSKEYNDFFNLFLAEIKKLAFCELEFNFLFTETYDFRPDHIAILEENSFTLRERKANFIEKDGKKYDSLIHICKNHESPR